MDRRSLLVGGLAGCLVATLAFATPMSPFRAVVGEPPIGSPPAMDPVDPMSPGRTITPSDGTRERGSPNPGTGTSGANSHAIALAGSVGSGESVVYYFDTDTQHLLVYQFLSGSKGGIRLLAARHFDFDLMLDEYRDLSFKSRKELKAAYDSEYGRSPDPTASKGIPELPVKKVDIPGGK